MASAEVIGADSSTTIFLYGPTSLSEQPLRIGVHAYKALSREQLSAITDRAWKIAPQAFPEHAKLPVLILHYDSVKKQLHVDAPTPATGVRAALDKAGPDGMNLIMDALRVYKTAVVADALVLFFKREPVSLSAESPADVGAVVTDALNAMDAAAYPQVDTTNEFSLGSFFKLI
jgi:hypothetical protein